jgi:hypothetical protein
MPPNFEPTPLAGRFLVDAPCQARGRPAKTISCNRTMIFSRLLA